jgi:hypothetical protein
LALPFYPPNTIAIAILLPVDAGVNPKLETIAPDAILSVVTDEFASSVEVIPPGPANEDLNVQTVPSYTHVFPPDVKIWFVVGEFGKSIAIFYLSIKNIIYYFILKYI